MADPKAEESDEVTKPDQVQDAEPPRTDRASPSSELPDFPWRKHLGQYLGELDHGHKSGILQGSPSSHVKNVNDEVGEVLWSKQLDELNGLVSGYMELIGQTDMTTGSSEETNHIFESRGRLWDLVGRITRDAVRRLTEVGEKMEAVLAAEVKFFGVTEDR